MPTIAMGSLSERGSNRLLLSFIGDSCSRYFATCRKNYIHTVTQTGPGSDRQFIQHELQQCLRLGLQVEMAAGKALQAKTGARKVFPGFQPGLADHAVLYSAQGGD